MSNEGGDGPNGCGFVVAFLKEVDGPAIESHQLVQVDAGIAMAVVGVVKLVEW